MFRAFSLAVLLGGLTACEPPGPTEAEIQASKHEKACGRLYEGQTKVFRDLLYKQKVPEDKVKFADKSGYVAKCIESAFTKEQMRCIDPNLRDKTCEETMKDVADKEKALKEFLFSPMKAETEEKPDGDAPAGDAAAPAGDAAAPAGDAAAPAGDAAAPAGDAAGKE